MDIVYILGTKSRWQNNELRYSLRSLSNLTNDIGQVWIVGFKPSWLKDVGHIKAADPHKEKARNITDKILKACDCPDISDDFWLMNDDFFFMKPQVLRLLALPSLKAKHVELTRSNRGGPWRIAMGNAIEYLKAKGIDEPINFDPHYPLLINKAQFKEFLGVGIKKPVLYRSVYGNLAGLEPEIVHQDFKISRGPEFRKMRDNDFISSSDTIVAHGGFRKLLSERLPKKSRWETGFVKAAIF